METPVIQLSKEYLETVYEPSEDSFLLIDALEMNLESMKRTKPQMCLEIGSGSGIVVSALAMAISKFCKSYFLAIDINPHACRATKEMSFFNNTDVEVVQMDLISCLNLNNVFDVIVFNPPYVVTESSEVFDTALISKTWAGGKDGREVMERIFHTIPSILSENGSFYLLVIKENNPEYIINLFKKLGLSGTIVIERKIRGEHLYVLQFRKDTLTNCG